MSTDQEANQKKASGQSTQEEILLNKYEGFVIKYDGLLYFIFLLIIGGIVFLKSWQVSWGYLAMAVIPYTFAIIMIRLIEEHYQRQRKQLLDRVKTGKTIVYQNFSDTNEPTNWSLPNTAENVESIFAHLSRSLAFIHRMRVGLHLAFALLIITLWSVSALDVPIQFVVYLVCIALGLAFPFILLGLKQ